MTCLLAQLTARLQIREVIAAQGIRIYTPPVDPSAEEEAEHAKMLIEAIPFSIIGSTEDVKTPDGRITKGREYMWGVAEGMFCRAKPNLASSIHLQSRMKTTATSRSSASF